MISAVAISPVALQMSCVAGLLVIAVLAIVLSRSKSATAVVYSAASVICAIALWGSLRFLLGGKADVTGLILPVGLPWLGAHFRLDALASFFLVVVNLGGAAASLYGLGYGHHEHAPHRVLPFFPAFLAGMNLVVLADDAFSYLLCWEFMSLASWALVMAHHREPGNARAGYIYLVMASFGTLALLLAFGLLAGPAGDYGFAAIRAAPHTPYVATPGADPDVARGRIKGRPRAAACLAAARASRGSKPCFRADERRHDQGRGLRLHPRHIRSAGASRPGGRAWSCSSSAASPPSWGSCTP